MKTCNTCGQEVQSLAPGTMVETMFGRIGRYFGPVLDPVVIKDYCKDKTLDYLMSKSNPVFFLDIKSGKVICRARAEIKVLHGFFRITERS